jgi:hypothetical protein
MPSNPLKIARKAIFDFFYEVHDQIATFEK